MDLKFVWLSPDDRFQSLILCFQLLNTITIENAVLEFAFPVFSEELTLRYYARPSCLNRSLPEGIFAFDDVSSFFVFGMVLCLDLAIYSHTYYLLKTLVGAFYKGSHK